MGVDARKKTGQSDSSAARRAVLFSFSSDRQVPGICCPAADLPPMGNGGYAVLALSAWVRSYSMGHSKGSPVLDAARFGDPGMRIVLYVHGSKEAAWDAAEKAGLKGEAVMAARFLGGEHKMEYEVDPKTGFGDLVAVDDRKVMKKKKKP